MKKLYRHLIVAAVLVAGFAAAFGSFLLFSPDDRGSGGLGVHPPPRHFRFASPATG